MIGDNLQQFTYEYLMSLALAEVPDDRDKREGSIIYDALAPCCMRLSAFVLLLKQFYTQTYAVTATGEDLDNRVAEQGLSRYPATYAVKKVTLADREGNPVIVPLGSRFSTVSDTSPVNYTITAFYKENDVIVPGSYEATCEELGTIGNEYYGNLVNITFIQGLASSIMSATLVPARDEETDDELRERYFESLNQKAFGGNIADYKRDIAELPGVGAVQVYPVWNGGGTVKLSIVDPSYNPCSPEYVATVQEAIDPENSQGQTGDGIGLAPIGHKVTIVTPTEVTINVSAKITLQAGYSMGQVEEHITTALANYIQSLKESWAVGNQLNIYSCDVFIARVSSAIITVPGIANVTDVLVNGEPNDIFLLQTGAVQQLPKLGEVSLSA